MQLNPLALSLGDPAGVGPELIVQAWQQRAAEQLPPFLVAGGQGVLADAARAQGAGVAIVPIDEPGDALGVFAEGIPVLGAAGTGWRPGVPDSDGAWLAWESLKWATALARDGKACAIVTAPVSKAALTAVGFSFPGQTEFLAHACGIPESQAVMMLAGPNLRTVPLTIHCALADVPRLLSEDLIVSRGRAVAAALTRDFGIAHPRIAVTGLNPHAGEGGVFGREEIDLIAPAIARLRSEGIDASGPHPADALFAPHKRNSFDVALCMYHDQALIPVKALDFDSGVNVTLGLPIIRTSPDHGTAFDIAGKGLAHPGALIAAIRMAGEMATRRADTRTVDA
ncbi:4-hydroxythreonine-4-phosphate dehydrogenase PdxA [Altererythrobacter sp. H2]|uniref:4-hydroxythreonine-4-phosphate dehydrogenase PdxA n=1 Tax=Altererythrobacter sp. H2 TaxID=3108391 RepID=UPI002B4BD51D|nr:4-hydroxythreonine-4-phosphate dehydrogenase PdxA [Altererythrobacter sp. H2]WRK97316.1 4-hydroxythreonine-4-phosphate dehydrogenase PdxA [Altererythrobacter sp. H2]